MKTESSLDNLRVQIQTQSGCNGRCVFCPNRQVVHSDLPQGRMDERLFRKIVGELAALRPRRVSPYLMNEPLLDPRLPDWIRIIADEIPQTMTLVTSNGTRLEGEVAEKLAVSGLKRLKISLQSMDPAKNAALMGESVDSSRVIDNVLRFKRLLERRGLKEPQLRVSQIVTNVNVDELQQTRRFWRRHRIRLVTSVLENRGGNIREAANLNPYGLKSRYHDCARPVHDLCILWNGDVVLCCVDWWRTTILGNVQQRSIRDVWTAEKVCGIRDAMKVGDTAAMPKICVHCAESARPDAHRRSLKMRILRVFGR